MRMRKLSIMITVYNKRDKLYTWLYDREGWVRSELSYGLKPSQIDSLFNQSLCHEDVHNEMPSAIPKGNEHAVWGAQIRLAIFQIFSHEALQEILAFKGYDETAHTPKHGHSQYCKRMRKSGNIWAGGLSNIQDILYPKTRANILHPCAYIVHPQGTSLVHPQLPTSPYLHSRELQAVWKMVHHKIKLEAQGLDDRYSEEINVSHPLLLWELPDLTIKVITVTETCDV